MTFFITNFYLSLNIIIFFFIFTSTRSSSFPHHHHVSFLRLRAALVYMVRQLGLLKKIESVKFPRWVIFVVLIDFHLHLLMFLYFHSSRELLRFFFFFFVIQRRVYRGVKFLYFSLYHTLWMYIKSVTERKMEKTHLFDL